MKAVKLYGIFLLVMAMMPGQVFAHAEWTKGGPTPPRLNENIKAGPCGNAVRSLNPIISTPNAIIKSEFNESIPHAGEFRISFSLKNDTFDKPFLIIPRIDNGNPYLQDLKMPYELCDDCTIQLIQFMEANLQNPFYFSCTDIVLKSPNINARITQPLISKATAAPGSGSITLNWVNPVNATFYKILVVGNAAGVAPNTDPVVDLEKKLFKTGDKINATKNNDVVVYNGKLNTTVFNTLMNASLYTYQIFAYDINLNYSKATTLSAVPSVTNVAPTVVLDVTQGNNTGTNVAQNGTDITISAKVTDGNLTDKHTISWVSNDFNFVDIDTVDKTFTIKADQIKPLPVDSVYKITATATDEGNLSGTSSVVITIKTDPPPSSIGNDVITNVADNGGCTISNTAKFDPLLLLLALFSLVTIIIKTRKRIFQEIQ